MSYQKEFDGEIWKASIEKDEDGRWSIQQWKMMNVEKGLGPIIPMGTPKTFYDKDVAKQTLGRLGYRPID